MKISVWDTYIPREDGTIMHFDILVPSDVTDEQLIVNFGKHYLQTKSFSTAQLTAKECRLCHIEHATEEIRTAIKNNGYSIIEMENCM